MAYYTYMLGCYKKGKGFTNFYIGQTNNLYARVGEHIKNVESRNTNSYTGRFDYIRLVWNK
ncbi:GIY-YIG nuclease family protein, partial [Candidatus Woesearchaeota archaeon]|nr:GIY-YIG nuclease family protein [Candidatus Woesearchaeota archaeon]